MSDLVISAANVLPGAGAQYQTGTCGSTAVTAGMVVYLDPATNTFIPADANASSVTATAAGIALHGSSPGQPLKIQTAGVIALGAVLTIAKPYFLSASNLAGGICAFGDVTSTWNTTILGVALTTGNLSLNIFNSGAVNA